VDWFDLQEVVNSLKLGSGEGYSGAAVDPMTGDLLDAVGDVMQTGSDGVTASVYRLGRGGGCSMEGLYLRLQDRSKISEKRVRKNRREQCFGRGNLQATLESAAVSWAWRIARSNCAASSSAARNCDQIVSWE
jgi:hypothetical protein